jgi:hypothetical protein
MGASQALAERDIADREGKKAHADRQHDNVQHGNSVGIPANAAGFKVRARKWPRPSLEFEGAAGPHA